MTDSNDSLALTVAELQKSLHEILLVTGAADALGTSVLTFLMKSKIYLISSMHKKNNYSNCPVITEKPEGENICQFNVGIALMQRSS